MVLALRQLYPKPFILEGIIGPRLEEQGAIVLVPMERLNVMGFVDPFLRLAELIRHRHFLIKYWSQHPPDLLVTIDAPDFNLSLALALKKKGIPVIHYVSPTVWAWRAGRVKTVAAAVDHLLALLPFEPDCYKNTSLAVSYVGHPMADKTPLYSQEEACMRLGIGFGRTRLTLLPGSRDAEIKRHLPIFLKTIHNLRNDYPDLFVIIGAVNEKKAQEIQHFIDSKHPDLREHYCCVVRDTPLAVAAGAVSLVVSGTATLEILLCGRPMVVAYKTSAFNYAIAKRVIKTPFIALPNILAQKSLVPECIQERCCSEILAQELKLLLSQDKSALLKEFQDWRALLKRGASMNVAKIVYAYLQKTVKL
jgi:lipid-A-disaccharide synthase